MNTANKRLFMIRCLGLGCVAAVAIAIILAVSLSPDDGVDWRIKYMIHPIAKMTFYVSGMYGDGSSFNRKLLELLVPKAAANEDASNSKDGVISFDFLIPAQPYPRITHPALEEYSIVMPEPASVPVRIFVPEEGRTSGTTTHNNNNNNTNSIDHVWLPLMLWIHGGGFVLGSAKDEMVDLLARRLARQGKMIVVSVDYRLAPEHPFPAAVEDCYVALTWCMAQGNGHPALQFADVHKLIVAGDSAGGNLAAVMTLLARDREAPIPIAHQLLVYPAVFPPTTTQSRKEFANGMFIGYLLSSSSSTFFNRAYLPNSSLVNHPYVSPLRAASHAGLPPAQIITAEYDYLRDDGKLYAEKLREAGVECVYRCYNRTVHGFFSFSFLSEADLAIKDTFETIDTMIK